jgi:hypothetical protein
MFAANYIGGFQDFDPDGNAFRVKSTVYCDVQLTYTVALKTGLRAMDWMNGSQLTLGVNDVFDKHPPFASGSGNNSDGYPSHLYSPTDRFVYVSVKKKF